VSITGQPLANLANPTASLASISVGSGQNIVNTGALNASVTQDTVTGTESSQASTANVASTVHGLAVTADLVEATCSATFGGPTTGTTTLTNASIDGVALAANPAPNTVIAIPPVGPAVLSVTLNEQIPNGDQLIVNAIHIRVLQGVAGNLIISQAQCGPAPEPVVPPVPLASGAGLYLGLGASALTAAGFLRKRQRARRIATMA
jgi:hypothetical protein